MKRQQRYITYGATGISLAAIGFDILQQWLEHKDQEQRFTWETYDGMRTFKIALLGGIAGAALGKAYYHYIMGNEAKLPFDPDEYLQKQISQENLKSDPELFRIAIDVRKRVKQVLSEVFKDSLVSVPEDTGSFHNRTANVSNYDFDIILPFKKNSYSSLFDMYNDVVTKLGEVFHNKAFIRKHTKAIGLIFDHNGLEFHFDIVPGREVGDYRLNKTLNLYKRPTWIWQKGSSFKINVNSQKRITINKPEARKAIRLIKLYRDRNNLNLPTIVIVHSVVRALSKNFFGTHYSITENLLNCMDFIANKLNHASVIDPANSNNNLTRKMSSFEKQYIANKLWQDIKAVEDNPHYLKEIFE